MRSPTHDRVRKFHAVQTLARFSYPEVGATHGLPPSARRFGTYRVDHGRVLLGSGAGTYERACRALRTWQMFGTDWVRLVTPNVPCEEGVTLVLHVRHLGFHSLIANRVVYVIRETDRFGFAYGTLTGHAEQGEERFLITRDAHGVWFELLAFSRPRHPLARLGAPFVRFLQRRAARAYLRALRGTARA